VLIRSAGVVVPAHDEEDMLPACLESLHRAAARHDVPAIRIVVVADGCKDRTAEVAAAGGAEVVEVCEENPGAARAAGFERLLATTAVSPDHVWLATTDADSEVPHDWLSVHTRLGRAGWDGVAGTVVVRDWEPGRRDTARRLAARYGTLRDGHGHVHGANLSLSGRAYLRCGGFPRLALAEDHALVRRLVDLGLLVARPGGSPVVTSGRRNARARGGFGALLHSLDRAS
jgi:glycosyltransferase involved in cell wall biosynthesis